jgi:hypothetical protein
MWTPTRVVVAFVLGGIVGLLLDQIHVRFGVLYYPRPFAWGQAWWVLPLFGATTLVVLSGAKLFARAAIGEHDLTGSALWFLAAYWASGVWQGHPIGLAVAYLGFFALRTTHGATWLFGIGLALGGVIVEALLCSLDAFRYCFPDLLGLPYWLPGLYAHGAPFALAVALRMRRFGG